MFYDECALYVMSRSSRSVVKFEDVAGHLAMKSFPFIVVVLNKMLYYHFHTTVYVYKYLIVPNSIRN